MTAIVALGCALCAATGLWICCVLEKRRSDALAREAHRLGLSFQSRSLPFAGSRVDGLTILPEGDSTEVANLLSGGTSARSVLIFDLSVYCESNLIVTTIAAFRNRSGGLPVCQIGPHNTLTRLDQYVTRNVVRSDSDNDFSSRFYVHTADESGVHDLLNDSTRRHLLRHSCEYRMDIGPDWILVYKPGKKMPCDSIQQFMTSATSMTEIFFPQQFVPASTGTDA
jgi:hypothetical protein